MDDKHKTKKQLIDELVELRQRVAELAATEVERPQTTLDDDRIQELQTAQEIAARNQRLLLSLSQAALAVQRAQTPDQVYQTVGDEIVRLGYEAFVFTLTADQSHLTLTHITLKSKLLRQAEKLANLSARDYCFAITPNTITGRVLSEKETIFSERITDSMMEDLPKIIRPLAGQIATMFGLKQCIHAPLMVGDQTIGLLAVAGADLSEVDLPAITAFANQIAIALENTRHYAAQRESEEMYKMLLETSPDAIITSDLEGRITYASHRAMELYHAETSEDLLGKDVFEPIVPEERSEAMVNLQRTLDKGVVRNVEYTLQKKDGTHYVGELSVALIKDAHGQPKSFMAVVRDITERKQMAEILELRVRERTADLAASEARYRALFESALDAVSVIDMQGNYLEVNPAFCQLSGYSQAELLTMNISQTAARGGGSTPEEQMHLLAERQVQWRRGEYGYRTQLLSKTKKLIDVEMTLTPLIYEGEEAVLSVIRDITERKQIEEELIRVQTLLKSVIKQSPVAMVVAAPDGTLEIFNDTCRTQLGIEDKDNIEQGTNIFEMQQSWQDYDEDGHPVSVEELPLALALQGKATTNKEIRVVRKDGTEIWEVVDGVPVYDQNGNLIAGFIIFPDITERKQAEAALRESQELFSLFMDRLPHGVFVKDENYVVTYVNRYMKDLFDAQHWYGKDAFAVFPPEIAAAMHADDDEALHQGQIMHEEAMPDKNGIEHVFMTTKFRIDRANKLPLLGGIGLDITDRIRAEEALQKYSEQLEEMVEARTQELREVQDQLIRREKLATLGQLAGGIAHELRNPLGSIKNVAYFLYNALEQPDPEVAQSLQILEREVEKSDRIISSLLDFARSRPPIYQPIDVNQIIQSVLTRLNIPDTIELQTQLAESLPVIQADPDQLDQIFGNLILNAVQSMVQMPSLETRLVICSQSETPQWIEVLVTDTGGGITDENKEKLFEPLFTTKAKGIGLGLALVKTLVEGHKGTITVTSQPGQGSTFTVKLPAGG